MTLKGMSQSPEHVANRVKAIRAGKGFKPEAAIKASADLRRGKPLSAEHKASIGAALMGNKHSLGRVMPQAEREWRSTLMKGRATAWLKGRKFSLERRQQMSAYWQAHPERHNRYVDGKSAERHGARCIDASRLEYRLWRERVFERDNWTCQHCGKRGGGELHADHIKPYATHVDLRYDVNNGRTLCAPCHRKTPTYGTGVHRLTLEML